MGKMICKVLSIVSLMSAICVVGSQIIQKPQYAVSSQSYHREDVPLSYKYSAIHPYPNPRDKDPHKEQNLNPLRYASIQYAPLPHSGKQKQSDRDYHTISPHLIDIGRYTYSTEGTPKKDHLEPQLIANNLEEHKQDYRSFIPEYKVEVPSPINQNTVHINPFVTSQVNFQDIKEKSPKLLYYKNLNLNHYATPSTFISGPEEATSETYIFEKEFQAPASLQSAAYQPKPKTLHELLVMEKPMQSYQHVPRLHLNIARIYSIAHQPQKAPQHATSMLEKTSLLKTNLAKPPALTQAVFIPNILDEQKTLLFPIRNQYKENLMYDIPQ